LDLDLDIVHPATNESQILAVTTTAHTNSFTSMCPLGECKF